MGIFSKLFGSDRVIDKGIGAIDAIVYTDQEKAVHKLSFLKAYEPFRVAQRLVALMVGIPYVTIHIILSVYWLVILSVPMSGERYDFLTAQLNSVGRLNNETLGFSFVLIVGFYFAGGAAEGIARQWPIKKRDIKK